MAPSPIDVIRTNTNAICEESLDSPFPELNLDLSQSDLRETAYEIFVTACGNNSVRTSAFGSKHDAASFRTSGGAGFLKKALRGRNPKSREHFSSIRGRKPSTVAELVMCQLEISSQSDARTRRALFRASLGQVGKSVDCMLVPLELLLYIGSEDFSSPQEYEHWYKRQLQVLKAGLILHPAVKPEGTVDVLSQRLHQMLRDASVIPVETGKPSEALQALRNASIARAGRKLLGQTRSDIMHWADGFPFNIHLYQMLLMACFDPLEETVLVEEFDEMLENLKKTWIILGINQMLHNLCFTWVLFRQFVITGETETSLLKAVDIQMKDVVEDARKNLSSERARVFKSTMRVMEVFAERRLISYRENFPDGKQEVMQGLLSLTLSGALIVQDVLQEPWPKFADGYTYEMSRVESYIRSSAAAAFAKMAQGINLKGTSFKLGSKVLPPLAFMAENTMLLALDEKANFSPVLREWHLCAAGVAASTLHSCYRKELKNYLSGAPRITVDMVHVLQAADELEKSLVEIVVEDALLAEDGGTGLIREILPFEAETVMEDLSKNWVHESVDRLLEWVDRNIESEEWNPSATKEGYAPSAVEVLRIIDENLNVFFALPASANPDILQELIGGIGRSVQRYCYKTVSSCG